MRTVAHRLHFIDILRDWFRHLFKSSHTAEQDSAEEFERFFGE
jgi:hypothetical protein